MINRPHRPQRRALLPFILALTLLAGCSSASQPASLTLNREGGDFEVYVDGKMVDPVEQGQIGLAPGAHRLMVGTREVKYGVTHMGAIHVEFVAESAGHHELAWRRFSRSGRGYWRAWVTDVGRGAS